jgi:hypothetical protein
LERIDECVNTKSSTRCTLGKRRRVCPTEIELTVVLAVIERQSSTGVAIEERLERVPRLGGVKEIGRNHCVERE